MRPPLKVQRESGVTAIHDKDGAFALPLWPRLHGMESLTLRVWQSLPVSAPRCAERPRPRSGLGDEHAPGRLRQGVHGRDARLGHGCAYWTAAASRGSRAVPSCEELIRHAAALDFPRRARHRRMRPAETRSTPSSTRVTPGSRPVGLRHRIEHAWLLAAEGCRAGELGVAASVPVLLCPRGPRPCRGRATARAPDRGVRLPLAARGMGRCSSMAPMRPWRSSTRSPASAPPCCYYLDRRPPWRAEEA